MKVIYYTPGVFNIFGSMALLILKTIKNKNPLKKD